MFRAVDPRVRSHESRTCVVPTPLGGAAKSIYAGNRVTDMAARQSPTKIIWSWMATFRARLSSCAAIEASAGGDEPASSSSSGITSRICERLKCASSSRQRVPAWACGLTGRLAEWVLNPASLLARVADDCHVRSHRGCDSRSTIRRTVSARPIGHRPPRSAMKSHRTDGSAERTAAPYPAVLLRRRSVRTASASRLPLGIAPGVPDTPAASVDGLSRLPVSGPAGGGRV